MITLLEEDSSSWTNNTTQIYRDRKPEFIQMLEQLSQCYHSLAEEYDHLRSQSNHALHSKSEDPNREVSVSRPESVAEDPDPACVIAGFEHLNNLPDDLLPTEPRNTNIREDSEIREMQIIDHGGTGDFLPANKSETTWSELKFQVIDLIEENLRQQRELLSRNDEKRAAIKGLRLQLERLKGENAVLRSCLECSIDDTKGKKFQTSLFRRILSGSFFRR
ncbi:protein NETWORKED 3A-like [Carica papaya]|uniref:protein NETWORKED 3A-like n=1 Tax=Carica papaya TaxID=3649 RepID=UPI000B8CDCCD|nr:protein NETWORKED 3A-like [Carica papaya]